MSKLKNKEEDIAKEAFKTWFRYYEFVVVPFGMTNALEIFTSLMNQCYASEHQSSRKKRKISNLIS